jgi:hypothetical protein
MVLGMHRSGTSAYTRIFGLLGADLSKNLLPPSPTNESGYWESRELVEIHDQVLSSGGSNWHDWRAFNPEWFDSPAADPFRRRILDILRRDFGSSPLFAIKDPRICRLWPLWRDVLAEFGAKPLIIIPIRNPLEVAASLKRRNGFNPAKSHLLWLRHALDAENATRGIPRAITSYQSLVEDWQDVIAGLTSQLRLSWPRRSATVDIEIEQFLSAEFKHHVVTPERLVGKPEVVDWVREAYATLTHMTEDAENLTGKAQLDRIRASFDKASAAFGVALAMNEMEVAKRDADVQRLSTDLSTLRDATAQREREEQAIAAGLSSELEAVRVAVNDRELKLAEHERKIAELGEQLSTTKQKSEDLIREREALAVALEGQKATAAQAAEQAALLGQETEALRRVVRHHETAAAKLRADFETMQSLAGERERERDAAAVALEGQKVAAARAAEQAAALGRETEALRGVVQDQEAAATKLHADLEAVQSLAGERERERDQLAAAFEEVIAEAERENAQVTLMGQELEALRNAVREHESAAAKLKVDLDSVRSLSNDRKSEIDKLSRELGSAQSAIRDRDREIVRLSHDVNAARLFLRDSQSEIQRLAGELGAAHAEIERAKTEHQRELQSVSASAAIRIRDLEGRLEAINGEKDRLAAELADTIKQIRRIEDNAAAREAVHVAALAESKAEAQAQIRALQEQLVDAEAALAKGRAERNRAPWKRLMSPSEKRRLGRQLVRSGLFDAVWYVGQYPETAKHGRSPVDHYLEEGYLRGFRPNPLFDSRWYLQRYEDVRRAGINPLVHYLQYGCREGRNPGPEFETDFYLLSYPDVLKSGINALAHYLRYGRHEGRLPLRPE